MFFCRAKKIECQSCNRRESRLILQQQTNMMIILIRFLKDCLNLRTGLCIYTHFSSPQIRTLCFHSVLPPYSTLSQSYHSILITKSSSLSLNIFFFKLSFPVCLVSLISIISFTVKFVFQIDCIAPHTMFDALNHSLSHTSLLSHTPFIITQYGRSNMSCEMFVSSIQPEVMIYLSYYTQLEL